MNPHEIVLGEVIVCGVRLLGLNDSAESEAIETELAPISDHISWEAVVACSMKQGEVVRIIHRVVELHANAKKVVVRKPDEVRPIWFVKKRLPPLSFRPFLPRPPEGNVKRSRRYQRSV